MQPEFDLPPIQIDPSRRFIRIRRIREDGFVEFDFAIGDPELSVELILPRAAYEHFAQLPGIEELSDRDAESAQKRQHEYLHGQLSRAL
jgi:phenol/toluene 2-monooxygenase (NADH) P0/A0